MALHCPKCNGTDTQALVDKLQCSSCGQLINPDGTAAAPGMDDSTRESLLRSLAPREVNVLGGFQDIQRIGAAAVLDGKVKIEDVIPDPTDGAAAENAALVADANEALSAVAADVSAAVSGDTKSSSAAKAKK